MSSLKLEQPLELPQPARRRKSVEETKLRVAQARQLLQFKTVEAQHRALAPQASFPVAKTATTHRGRSRIAEMGRGGDAAPHLLKKLSAIEEPLDLRSYLSLIHI